MSESIRVPIRTIGKSEKWGALQFFGRSHEVCAEKVHKLEENYTFAGGHRVRLYRLRDVVHWKIPIGIQLDISGVTPKPNGHTQSARRQGRR